MKEQLRELLKEHIEEKESVALISIHPQYVEKIIKNEKKYEYRKVKFRIDVKKIFIYATVPIKKIVGYILVDEIINEMPEQMWSKTSCFAGLSKPELFHYAKNKPLFAYHIKKFTNLDFINPYVIGEFAAPQSIIYF